MNTTRRTLGVSAAVVVILLIFTIAGENTFANSEITLSQADCIKCHEIVFTELDEGKSKHKSKVVCIECHSGGHPPKSDKGNLFVPCSKCHDGLPHFELSSCTNCHHKPHQPNKIVLEGEGQKDTCGTCHPDKVTEINTHVTSHTGFACSFCHKLHRDQPNCLSCHDPHEHNQVFEDCIKCHQAHQPLTLHFNPNEITNNECGACHSDIQTTLEDGPSKHAKMKCVFCHGGKHGEVPGCTKCHRKSHDRKMIRNFESCNECHQSAHDVLR